MLRLKLVCYFAVMAIASILHPAAGLQVVEDEKKARAERRRLAQSLGGGLRVGDKA